MKLINVKKCILICLATVLSVAHRSQAIGLAVGPSVGLTGLYSSLDSPNQNTYSISNTALQLGLFTKLDIWLLYAKIDPMFVLDWRHVPNNINTHLFKHITMPVTIGVPLFGMLRPHIGIIFRIPFEDKTSFQGNSLIEKYREKVNSYLFGLGIDIGNFIVDLSLERAFSSITIESIDPLLSGNKESYTPKQFALRVGYNLLGC